MNKQHSATSMITIQHKHMSARLVSNFLPELSVYAPPTSLSATSLPHEPLLDPMHTHERVLAIPR